MFRHPERLGRLVSFGVVGLMMAVLTSAARAEQGAKTAASSTGTAKPAEIILHVPAGAEVWFNDDKTTRTGLVRVYETPALPPGRDFHYQLRVKWTDGDGTTERNQQLTFRAGDEITLHFGKPKPTQKWVYYHVPTRTTWASPPDFSNTTYWGSSSSTYSNPSDWRAIPAPDPSDRSWTAPTSFDNLR